MIIVLSVLFLGLILFPSISFHGAITGMTLWASKVFPALFPAMLITSCIMQLIPAKSVFAYIYIVLSGIFCGYPTGAFACAQYHRNNPNETLCPQLMGYCNISGTAFIINYIYYSSLNAAIPLFPMLLIVYMPPLLLLGASIVLQRIRMHLKKSASDAVIQSKPEVIQKKSEIKSSFADAFNQAVTLSVENSLKLGGYIVFFSCISAYISQIFSNHELLSIVFTGVAEITNGIGLTAASTQPLSAKLLLITLFNAFGGLSTIMQTSAVIAGSGLSIKKYIYQKLLCTLLTLVIAAAFIYVFL